MNKLYVVIALAAVVACSSSKKQEGANDAPSGSAEDQGPLPGDPADATASTPADSSTPTDSGSPSDSGPKDLASCVAACEAAHVSGKKLGSAIDACWTSKCSPACTDDLAVDGGVFAPDTDASACQTDVKTPSAACSDCTAANCCAAWDACFSNADCIALNDCSVACYSTFTK